VSAFGNMFGNSLGNNNANSLTGLLGGSGMATQPQANKPFGGMGLAYIFVKNEQSRIQNIPSQAVQSAYLNNPGSGLAGAQQAPQGQAQQNPLQSIMSLLDSSLKQLDPTWQGLGNSGLGNNNLLGQTGLGSNSANLLGQPANNLDLLGLGGGFANQANAVGAPTGGSTKPNSNGQVDFVDAVMLALQSQETGVPFDNLLQQGT
jgi:hypothetical protein